MAQSVAGRQFSFPRGVQFCAVRQEMETWLLADAEAINSLAQERDGADRQPGDTGFPCYPLFERDPGLNPRRGDPRFIEWLGAQKKQWEQYKATMGG